MRKPNSTSAILSAIIALSALVPGTALARDTEPAPDKIALARLDGYAMALTESEIFSGVILVAHDGKLLFERPYGKRDQQGEDPVTTDMRFNIASAGKMFTATAILQLIAVQKLSLDTKVGDVIKDYPNSEFAQKVTVRNLLTHMAGAGDIDIFGANKETVRANVRSHADMLALHWERAPAFEPGTQQVYGNFGHVVLGRMIELLSGQDYDDYIRTHIFAPAGMSRTDFANCADYRSDTAIGYATVDGKAEPNCITQPTKGFAAGGAYTTAGDLFRFVEALRQGRLVPKPLFAQAIATQHGFMGLGFFATDYGKDVPKRDFRWGHGGSSDGVCADVRSYPNTGETIIVLSNRDAPACFSIASLLHRAHEEGQRAH
ncbi:MAG: serine hydrolase domain-containing protein [Sphingorhabdus sp.]